MAKDTTRIEARTLKGFRDYLPAAALPREWMMETARKVYRSFGYAPIDTPALEYEEVLAGKAGAESEKQMFRFEDHGGRRVALRFDLTVPLARFVAEHADELGTPFKRYHIGTVWRGEKPQRGRYREFLQCDFDTIGTESPAADVETVLVVVEMFRALGFPDAELHVNDRRILSGLLERIGIAERSTEVLRALDKIGKVGPARVAEELREVAGASEAQVASVLGLAQIRGSNDDVLGAVAPLVAGSEVGERGLAALTGLAAAVRAAGAPEGALKLDVSIARGLDYYTGLVIETFLRELPEIGSVCSGGRYDDLASLYTNRRLPGVGASLGVDRLLAAMEELGRIEARTTPAAVFVPWFVEERYHDYLALAARLRAAGLAVELYPEAKKLGIQLKYADRRGFPLALVIGGEEWERGEAQLKDLKSGESTRVALPDLIGAIQARLAAACGKS